VRSAPRARIGVHPFPGGREPGAACVRPPRISFPAWAGRALRACVRRSACRVRPSEEPGAATPTAPQSASASAWDATADHPAALDCPAASERQAGTARGAPPLFLAERRRLSRQRGAHPPAQNRAAASRAAVPQAAQFRSPVPRQERPACQPRLDAPPQVARLAPESQALRESLLVSETARQQPDEPEPQPLKAAPRPWAAPAERRQAAVPRAAAEPPWRPFPSRPFPFRPAPPRPLRLKPNPENACGPSPQPLNQWSWSASFSR